VISPHSLRDPRREFPRWAEDFARALAPIDLAGPFYCVDAPLGPHVLGLSGADLDSAYRSTIERWEGRGPAVALDLGHCWAEFLQGWSVEYGTFPFIWRALALFVHEFGHTLTRERLYGDDLPETTVEAITHEEREVPYERTTDCKIPWLHHDGQWVRCVLHLMGRARTVLRFGIENLDNLIVFSSYRLSPLVHYRACLGDEPRRLAGQSFATIRKTAPPRAFESLWQADIARWFRTLDSPTDLQVFALSRGQDLFPSEEFFSMSSLLTEAAAICERRKTERQNALQDLAGEQVATGKVTPERIVDACEAAGVALQEFENILKHRARRKTLLQSVADKVVGELQKANAERAIEAANAEFALAQQRHAEAFTPAATELAQANARLSAAEEARRELAKSCKDASILTRLAKNAERHGPAYNRLILLQNRELELGRMLQNDDVLLAGYQGILVNVPAPQGSVVSQGTITKGGLTWAEGERYLRDRAAHQTELEQVRAELETLRPIVAALEAERADLLRQAEISLV
jgi:hypothetical protein